mmetsp:Transcript_27212/g.54768  ORF Transcript_27212/g.54768 Transcript_27212/m.54768 type:complete len:293 (-) Transcript_27212:143-1021(-)
MHDVLAPGLLAILVIILTFTFFQRAGSSANCSRRKPPAVVYSRPKTHHYKPTQQGPSCLPKAAPELIRPPFITGPSAPAPALAATAKSTPPAMDESVRKTDEPDIHRDAPVETHATLPEDRDECVATSSTAAPASASIAATEGTSTTATSGASTISTIKEHECTAAQLASLAQLRSMLAAKDAADSGGGSAHEHAYPADSHEDPTDDLLMRFLRARKWDVPAALNQFLAAREWRRANDVGRWRRAAPGPFGKQAARQGALSGFGATPEAEAEAYPQTRLICRHPIEHTYRFS